MSIKSPPTFKMERELLSQGYRRIVGVDEAGCGALAGPVVAAAVIFPVDSRIGGIRDSKLLSERRREELFPVIVERVVAWAVGMASVEEIATLNIRGANLLAMRRAVEAVEIQLCPIGKRSERPIMSDRTKLVRASAADIRRAKRDDIGHNCISGSVPSVDYVLVDAWTIPGITIPQCGIIRGDRTVKSIAAASIIAKVTRDRLMAELSRAFPQYGFEIHKGYGTKAHREAIAEHGPCVHHRLTFL